MSSFKLERDQIDCTCFESNTQKIRRIFKSDSNQKSNIIQNQSKKINLSSQLTKYKNTKKSLKKQKPLEDSCPQQEQQIRDQHNYQYSIKQQPVKTKKKQIVFKPIELTNIACLHTDKTKPLSIKETVEPPIKFFSQNIILKIPSKTHHFSQSELVRPERILEYEKFIQEQFKKDFAKYKMQMQSKQRQDYYQITKIHFDEKHSIQKTKLIDHKINQKPVKQSLTHFAQFEKKIQSGALSKPFSTNNIANLNINQSLNIQDFAKQNSESQPQIPLLIMQKTFSQFQDSTNKREKKQSLRKSTGEYNYKQIQKKKIRNQMYAKQIESQKDETSKTSSQMSQVVGKGLDGLISQKNQIEELDQIIKNQNGRSQTMVTLGSQIKNSQIKTFTDFSNSMISPKSQRWKPMHNSSAFGRLQYNFAGAPLQSINYLEKQEKNV